MVRFKYSCACKRQNIIRTLIYDYEFLNKKLILYKYQFGFRKLHSTYMALMILMDKLINALENGEFVIGVGLRHSKSQDNVTETEPLRYTR